MQDLNLDEDRTSDEYDFMDDAEDGDERTSNRRNREDTYPKIKYMKMLQKVSDRQLDQVTVELDDLAEV